MGINEILSAKVKSNGDIIRVAFKKTINTAPYETEVVEAESSACLYEENLTGIEKDFITALMQAQLEFEVYFQIACKGHITQEQFDNRKNQLVSSVEALKAKATSLGVDLSKYI